MKIIISNSVGIPIYEQIKEQIKSEILSGNLKEGDTLPSIRQLAKDLKISVITTTRAYNDLSKEGFITNVQGKGCYILPQNNELVKEQLLKDIEESFLNALKSAKTAKLTKKELEEIFYLILEGDNYE